MQGPFLSRLHMSSTFAAHISLPCGNAGCIQGICLSLRERERETETFCYQWKYEIPELSPSYCNNYTCRESSPTANLVTYAWEKLSKTLKEPPGHRLCIHDFHWTYHMELFLTSFLQIKQSHSFSWKDKHMVCFPAYKDFGLFQIKLKAL